MLRGAVGKLGATLLAVVTVACAPRSGDVPLPGHAEVGVATPEETVVTIDPAARSSLTEEILADGVVTHAEMERALLATVACVEEEGFEVLRVSFAPGRSWGFDVADRDHYEVESVLARCSALYLDEVSIVYADGNQPTESELEEERMRVQVCLEDAGYEITEGLGILDMRALVDDGLISLLDFIHCASESR